MEEEYKLIDVWFILGGEPQPALVFKPEYDYAVARDVTCVVFFKAGERWIRDYRPAKDIHLRPVTPQVWRDYKSFNTRTRMGCDCLRSGHTELDGVSIHAPAWGATVVLYHNCLDYG